MENHENRPGTMQVQPGRNKQKRYKQNLPIIYRYTKKVHREVRLVDPCMLDFSLPYLLFLKFHSITVYHSGVKQRSWVHHPYSTGI